MLYRCRSCKLFFSVRTGTALGRSKVPLKNSLKGVSGMKLHRDLKVTQKTAWFMAHRIRQAWEQGNRTFAGPAS